MCHALIIEDEPFIAMQIEDVLREGGADTVTIAATQADAVEAARTVRPDFIISDVRLLEGTGPDAVVAIRSMYDPVPVTFITAWPEACHEVASAEVLQKPVRATALLESFKRAVPDC